MISPVKNESVVCFSIHQLLIAGKNAKLEQKIKITIGARKTSLQKQSI